ncbi:tyrosine-type recombinase/integrase [Flagellimonas sp.]|uniref:tyrosine-type recombinase/integrase n=1 Tax=Flagellimonas sp. TaxID=2058762 RepID=UPI003B52247F
MEQEGRVRTAENYSLSYRRLKGYINLSRIKKLDDIPFEKISVGFLKKYEKYLVNEGCSLATIGIYLRPLRAIFNLAINDPNSGLRESMYPFGKSQYQIPTGQNVKKALSPEQLKTLFESKPENDQQKKAKDFWFFSYLANGMNFKDIAELKYGNLSDNRISFYRAKTQRTTKSNPKLIQAMLPVFALNVIEEYGNKNSKSEDYIFPILSQSDSALQAANKVKDFTRFVNQHIKKLAMENGITDEISTYWARHSFTTQAIRKGASMELLQESLGHKSLSTTQNYFAGFSNDVKQKLSESLLNFD